MEAQEKLKAVPLILTQAQAQYIDKSVKSAHISALKKKYNGAVKTKKLFDALPPEAQTVIASVSFQYGVDWIGLRRFFGEKQSLRIGKKRHRH